MSGPGRPFAASMSRRGDRCPLGGTSDGDPGDFISTHTGVVHAGAATGGESFFDVCDALSPDPRAAHAPLNEPPRRPGE